MIRLALLTCFVLLSATGHPQSRLLLAGNTADADAAFYRSLRQRLNGDDPPQAVLFAGDYIPECTTAMQDYQAKNGNGGEVFPTVAPLVNLVRQHPDVKFYLVPGDRDWDMSGENGLRCVKRLGDYLHDQRLDNLHWPLANGCPGPELIDFSDEAALLLINTQWWNHPYDKPVPADVDCETADSDIAIEEMLSQLKENKDRNVVIAGHYPPISQGRYGGEYPARDHFTPPVWGSLHLSWRQNIGSPEELTNPRMEPLHRALRNNAGSFDGLFLVGAQDRSQQLLAFRQSWVVNVGAAGPGDWVARHRPAAHVSRQPGFTELVFGQDGRVDYAYHPVGADQPVYRQKLYHSPCNRTPTEVPVNPAAGPCDLSDDEVAAMCVVDPGATLQLAPGPEYAAGAIKKWFLGKHYRDAWTTPVSVPVRTATSLEGGLEPIRRGGGLQTNTLRFRAQDGREFAFRSVNKSPRRSLDYELRPTFVGDIVEDQTTIGHPFGPLVAARLLDSLNILHVNPDLFILGNCPGLGDFNPLFGGMLGTLEEVPKGRKKKQNIPGTFGAKAIHKSYEAFSKRFDDQEVAFAHDEFLRARLFDLLIGDWNRHEDNWKWAEYEEEGIKILRPIPRDRDNAFSLIDGLGPRFAAKVFLTRLEHFGFDKPDAGSLSYQSRHLDRFILSPLVRKDYLREARIIQAALSDEIIEQAVRRMPGETYAVSGEEITLKLKARRDALEEYANDLYDRYAETVDVIGTNDEERFTVRTLAKDSVEVTVTDVKGRSAGQVLYHRVFSPEETREIRLYGLSDDDVFELAGHSGGPIRVRLIGGPGKDEFRSETDGKGSKVAVYERSKSADAPPPPGMRFVKSYRDYLYHYDRTAHEFNKISPAVGADFSGFNGLSLGAGLKYTRYNFKHRDYAAKYKLYFESTLRGNYLVELTADINDVFRGVDLWAKTHYGVPDFVNFFFGIGNNSVFERDSVDRNQFHLIRLRNVSGELGLARPFAGRSYVNLMGGFQYNKPEDTENTILEGSGVFGGDQALTYAYLRPEFRLDLRDDRKLPTKGVMLEGRYKRAFSLDEEGDFSVTTLGAEAHISGRRIPVTLSLRVGYAASSGRVPFYELPAIGLGNGLRGFQRRRFAGDGYVYYNTEFRTPITTIRGRFIPLRLGARVFYDRGKLLMDDEGNEPMRDAYGFGIYVVPISTRYSLSATAGFSEEEAPVIRISGGVEF